MLRGKVPSIVPTGVTQEAVVEPELEHALSGECLEMIEGIMDLLLGPPPAEQGAEGGDSGDDPHGEGYFEDFEQAWTAEWNASGRSGTPVEGDDWRSCMAVRAARRRLAILQPLSAEFSGAGGIPVLTLPLRLTLARGSALGVPDDMDAKWCANQVMQVNVYWAAAGIQVLP
jgi:hypothetical protein